jgi:chitin disaccharide deacetylase
MKRLIVNADDLGADHARNDGIFEAIDAGIITGVSLLANAPATNDAISRLRLIEHRTISIGLHFTLSEGTPLAKGHKKLIAPDGAFRGKKETHALLSRVGDEELEGEIRREFIAQASALLEAGIAVDHLDGHQHVHIFPSVVKVALEEAKDLGFPWFRIPLERAQASWTLPPELRQETSIFNEHAECALAHARACGIAITDHFRGLFFKGNLPADNWQEFLADIPEGLAELMVHPGRAAGNSKENPFSKFSTPARELELQALIDGRFRSAIIAAGVELVSFSRALI